jgi:hypothetical protein
VTNASLPEGRPTVLSCPSAFSNASRSEAQIELRRVRLARHQHLSETLDDPDFESEGREFESLRARQIYNDLKVLVPRNGL